MSFTPSIQLWNQGSRSAKARRGSATDATQSPPNAKCRKNRAIIETENVRDGNKRPWLCPPGLLLEYDLLSPPPLPPRRTGISAPAGRIGTLSDDLGATEATKDTPESPLKPICCCCSSFYKHMVNTWRRPPSRFTGLTTTPPPPSLHHQEPVVEAGGSAGTLLRTHERIDARP